MPSTDITYCANHGGCAIRHSCLRCPAERQPDLRGQAWSDFYRPDRDPCPHYYPRTGRMFEEWN